MQGTVRWWYETKLFFEHSTAVSTDALHILVGMLLVLLVAGLFRRSLADWLPWTMLFLLLLFNEAVDLWVERWPNPGMQLGEGARDVALTMFLPSVLLIAVRLRPRLFRPPQGGGSPLSEPAVG